LIDAAEQAHAAPLIPPPVGGAMSDQPERVSLEEVTNAAFNGVLRALETRKISPERFPGPILIGIIAWPELSQFGERMAGQLGQRAE
jgi:hypothetical protein